ncbi:MAG: hypothetical protein WA821_10765 [Anaerolineales bacterium]
MNSPLKKKNLLIFAVILFTLSACGLRATATLEPTPLPTATIAPTDTPAPTVVENMIATPVPTNTPSPKYDAALPVASIGDKATQEEIARALFKEWLDHDAQTRIGSLEAYTIDEVTLTTLPGREYGVDFVVGVVYSVNPGKEGHGNWIAGNGVASENDTWIRSKFLFIGVRRDNDLYVLDIIGTGP